MTSHCQRAAVYPDTSVRNCSTTSPCNCSRLCYRPLPNATVRGGSCEQRNLSNGGGGTDLRRKNLWGINNLLVQRVSLPQWLSLLRGLAAYLGQQAHNALLFLFGDGGKGQCLRRCCGHDLHDRRCAAIAGAPCVQLCLQYRPHRWRENFTQCVVGLANKR
jgi:hypothetical protein